MGGVRRLELKRGRFFCKGVGGCERASMREEIPNDNQDAIRHTWI